MLVFDTETRIDATQRLTFGSYQFLTNGECQEEGLFFPHDLPEQDRKVLELYASEHPAEATNTELKLLTLKQFLSKFYQAVYKGRCLLVGFNLPFDLSRIARDTAAARGRFAGGFSLELWSYFDESGNELENRFRPRVGIKHIDGKRALKGFTARNGCDPTDLIPDGSPTGITSTPSTALGSPGSNATASNSFGWDVATAGVRTLQAMTAYQVLAAALAAEVALPPLAIPVLTATFIDAALKLTGSGVNVLSYVGSDDTQAQMHRATAYVSIAGFVVGTVTAVATRNAEAFYEMSQLANDVSDLGGLKPSPETAESIIITIEKLFDFSEAKKTLKEFIEFEQRMDQLTTPEESSGPALTPWSENSTSDGTNWAGTDLNSPGGIYDTSPESNA